MKGQITKQQIIILFVLVWALVVAVVLMYVIFPMNDEYDIAEESLLYNEDQYQELLLAEPTLSVLTADIADVTEKINKTTEDLYAPMTTEQADKLLQEIFSACGVRANILMITEPEAIENTEYKYVAPKTESTTEEATVDESSEETGTSDVEQYIEDVKEIELPSTGIIMLRANYELFGEYKNILKVISEINKLPSVTIQTVDFSASKDEEEIATVNPNGEQANEQIDKPAEKLTTVTEYNLAVVVFMK